ncbi:MAG: AI-2E family transporter [Rubrivivax sp.]|nr:AI-2E family transporter [Pyrinomonadaceae bacterium]
MDKRQNQARWLALLLALAFVVYLCWLMVRPFLDVLAWAAVLVVLFYPVHRRLVERTRRPAVSALVSCVLVILVILLPLSFITVALVREFSGAAQGLQNFAASLLDPNSPTTGRLIGRLGQYVDVEHLRSPEAIKQFVERMSGTIAQSTVGLVGGALGAVVQIFFIIFTMYYLFRDGAGIVRGLPAVLPLEAAQSEEIFARTKEVIGASVYGVLVIAAIQGALGGLAFWMLGLPSPLVWGVVMAFFSLIPMAGSFVVWVPAALYLAATQQWWKAGFLVFWGAIVIGMVDNFLRPKLVGEKTKLHELFIFFSVLGGLQVFGVLGLVLGPVVLAITLALFDVVRQADKTVAATLREETLLEKAALRDDSGRESLDTRTIPEPVNEETESQKERDGEKDA